MFVQKYASQAKQRCQSSPRFSGLSLKYEPRFFSSFILPLLLGTFTIVFTVYQVKLAQINRMDDINRTEKNRMEDLKWAEERRQEDQHESRLERQQDWNRIISDQEERRKVATEQYRDQVLASYIKEIGDLLEKKNGSLTSDPLTHILARVKTLNVFRQLDGSRQRHIISFLHEAHQLTNTDKSVALDISTARLKDINFPEYYSRFVTLDRTSLAGVRLQNCTFATLIWRHVNFSSARFFHVNFSSARLDNVNFSSASLFHVTFSSARFSSVDFSFVKFDNLRGTSHFCHASMSHTIFTKCDCHMTDFTGADLNGSSFRGANLSAANFSLANLQNADFTNSTITDKQLLSALSIRNARLPNGTLGHGQNLITNGNANCNTSLVDPWQVQNGSIIVAISKEDQSKCYFSLQSVTSGASMWQRINLTHSWNSSVWTDSTVELQVHMSDGVSIELSGKASNGTVLQKELADSTKNKTAIALKVGMQALEIVVIFNAHNNTTKNENRWCTNIELFINYGRLYEK